MNFRTSHLVGLFATGLVAIAAPSINSVVAEPLKITGPDGQVKLNEQSVRQYGPTTSADTFWSIAQAVKPDNSITVYQVMAALYDANPHAFSSKNYNSLERGMILLVPTKAVMQQISQADAKARAERNDRNWSSTVAVKPRVAPKVVAPKVQAPKESAAVTPTVATKANPLIAELSAEVEALTKQLEQSQTQNLELTDELARASDEIVVGSSDTEAFQQEIEQLKEENALLKQALQDSKSENEALNQELQLKQQQLGALSAPKQEPTADLWRTIMDNPLLLVAGAILPALLIVALFWLFIRRRNESHAQESQAEEALEEKESKEPQLETQSDDADDLAVHLDTDDTKDDDKPLQEIAAANAVRQAEEQDIVVEEAMDEGQSLDDLWAEAMGEQEQTDEFNIGVKTAEEDDLDSLLAGFDEPEETSSEAKTNDNDDDLDALLAGFDAPEETSEKVDVNAHDEDDLDALLAGFNEPAQDEPTQAQATETETTAQEDDIDALLAGFDEPAQAPATETEVTTQDDDLDVLLAGFDEPAQAQATETETTAEDDDLDALLAELEGGDQPQDANSQKDIDSLSDEMAAELEAGFEIAAELELDHDTDIEKSESELDSELDALLADLEAPSAESEVTVEIEAEAKPEHTSVPELEAELESEEKLDSTLAPVEEARVDTADTAPAKNHDSNSLDFDLSDFEAVSPTSGLVRDEAKGDSAENLLDFTLPEEEFVPNEPAPKVAASETLKAEKESGFFDDLKGNKKIEQTSLNWESIATETDDKAETTLDFDVENDASTAISDEELFKGLASEGAPRGELELTDDETFTLDDNKLTVDEALAALDAEEANTQASSHSDVAMHDLTSFQKDNGFIDIDRLLSEADEDNGETDLYKELDVDMGDLDSLKGNTPMVDVDDEENSVNAKLDLARAYIEIDDSDSARALLKEVELDGNDRQQAEAAGLLKELV